MKKIISMLCSLAIIVSATAFTASAEAPVPAEMDEQAYSELLKDRRDRNGDGIIDESELSQIYGFEFDLDGVKDISWLSKMKKCEHITFSGGDITDFSVLKEMPQLREITFNSVPLTDISFVKELNIEGCYLKDMDQITFEQRMEVAKMRDVEIEKGFTNIIGVYPVGIFGESKIEFKYDDTELVAELDRRYDNYDIQRSLYGIKEGTTKCHAYIDGVERFTCQITVAPLNYISPQLNSNATSPVIRNSFYYGNDNVIIDNKVLYGIRGDQYYKAVENVKDFSRTYKKNAYGDYVYIDLVLQNNGTLLLNDKVIEGIRFESVIDGCALTADGTLYFIFPHGEEPVLVKAGEKCKELISADKFYLDNRGELVWCDVDYDSKGEPVLYSRHTGIMNPRKAAYNYFIDENNVLWEVNIFSYFKKTKVAEDVIDLGYYNSSLGYRTEIYTTSDGRSYVAYSKKEVEVYEDVACPTEQPYLQKGYLYIPEYDGKYDDGTNSDLLIDWFITYDSILTLNLAGKHFAISDVSEVIDEEYVKYQDKGYAWFIRKDGSVWRYCFEDEEAVQMTPLDYMPEILECDVNLDGQFNIADVVTFQKWLLGDPDTKLADWRAADVCGGYSLDIFDLCAMKKKLLQKLN